MLSPLFSIFLTSSSAYFVGCNSRNACPKHAENVGVGSVIPRSVPASLEYIFNLIDTPGHVDFNYEVSRSLAACEGAILVVDAAQGIEAQTLANVYLAIDHDLDVMPVINKIDLPSAEPERVVNEIEDVIGIEAQDAPRISAKNGINIDQVLEQIVTKIPALGKLRCTLL